MATDPPTPIVPNPVQLPSDTGSELLVGGGTGRFGSTGGEKGAIGVNVGRSQSISKTRSILVDPT